MYHILKNIVHILCIIFYYFQNKCINMTDNLIYETLILLKKK